MCTSRDTHYRLLTPMTGTPPQVHKSVEKCRILWNHRRVFDRKMRGQTNRDPGKDSPSPRPPLRVVPALSRRERGEQAPRSTWLAYRTFLNWLQGLSVGCGSGGSGLSCRATFKGTPFAQVMPPEHRGQRETSSSRCAAQYGHASESCPPKSQPSGRIDDSEGESCQRIGRLQCWQIWPRPSSLPEQWGHEERPSKAKAATRPIGPKNSPSTRRAVSPACVADDSRSDRRANPTVPYPDP